MFKVLILLVILAITCVFTRGIYREYKRGYPEVIIPALFCYVALAIVSVYVVRL